MTAFPSARQPLAAPRAEGPLDALGLQAWVAELRSRHLQVPVAGVAAHQLRDTFTDARGGAAARRHDAIDIMAPTGTEVLAVEDGRIAKLFTSKAGGLTVYQFDPEARLVYYYAHLDRYTDGLKEGQAVTRGQTLGHVGATGNASPQAPHLHFAIHVLGPEAAWWKGEPLNPFEVWRPAR